jgi:hypothetical protein
MKAVNGRKVVPKAVRITRARAGGVARKRALTKAQRAEIARRAVLIRYERSTPAMRSEAARQSPAFLLMADLILAVTGHLIPR